MRGSVWPDPGAWGLLAPISVQGKPDSKHPLPYKTALEETTEPNSVCPQTTVNTRRRSLLLPIPRFGTDFQTKNADSY